MHRFALLRGLLILGVVLGFSSGIVSVVRHVHHARHGCAGGGPAGWHAGGHHRGDGRAGCGWRPWGGCAADHRPGAGVEESPQLRAAAAATPRLVLVLPDGGVQAVANVIVQPQTPPSTDGTSSAVAPSPTTP